MEDEMVANNITRFTDLCNMLAFGGAQAAYLYSLNLFLQKDTNRFDKNTYEMYL